MTQQCAHGAGRGCQDPAPQHRDGQRDADPRQHIQRAEYAAARQVASQQGADGQPQHGLDRHHNRHERTCHQQGVTEGVVGEHRAPILAADILDRPEKIPAMQAQPHHHQDRQQQKSDNPEQARCEQGVSQSRRSAPGVHPCGAHKGIKACRYGGVVTPNRGIDADFLSLPRHELADAALAAATAAGASHADLRIHRLVNEIIQLRDGELETAVLNRDIGLAVRVVVDGTWGFASHAELSPAVAAETARPAVGVARTLAALNNDRVELASEPVYSDASWVSSYRVDPFTVPLADKITVLDEYSGRLLAADGINHVSASLMSVKEQTFYADAAGSSITQQRVRVQPRFEAITVDSGGSGFDSMRTLAPPMGRGWEVLAGDDVWNWPDELAQLPSQLAEKVKAPSVRAGR